MNKDFLIILPETINLKNTNKILHSLMKSKTIKVSKKNYIVVGLDEKIVFDIEKKVIKGRILHGGSQKEVAIIKKLIDAMDENIVYTHFYDKKPFFYCQKAKVV